MAQNVKGVVIIGCGDIGRRLAQRWQERGVAVTALARSGDAGARLQSLGLRTVRGDLDKRASLAALAEGVLHQQVVYYLAPPPGEGDEDPRMANFLAGVGRENCPAQLVYMGTSGVYGDSAGGWVDEQSPLNPQTGRARRRLAAEQMLQDAAARWGFPLTLLRVGGIYGPERLPQERLRRGLPVLREAECGYSNRIHVEDLLRICVACAEKPGEGVRVFNVSDNHPGNMTQYFVAVADALGLAHPPQLSLEQARQQLSPAMLSYLEESRRMDSSKVLRELGITLRYPDLASGLAALQTKPPGD